MTAHWLVKYRGYCFCLNKRAFVATLLLSAILLGLSIQCVVSGSQLLTISDLLVWGQGESLTPLQQKILTDIRFPFVLTALFAGGCLGASGAVFQAVSRNPLGSPDILGFTAGAATGAVWHIVFVSQAPWGVALSAFGGGCVTAFIIYISAIKGQVLHTSRLILVGIGVGATLTAITGFMLVKGDLDNAMLATLWLYGSLDGRQWGHAFTVILGLVFGLPLLILLKRAIVLTEMGDAMASSLGVNIPLCRLVSIFTAVILVSLATASVGPIAFIALGAPHLARGITGQRLPVVSSSLVGALLLLLADRIRFLVPVLENQPVGRITALIGGLYLIVLLIRQQKTSPF